MTVILISGNGCHGYLSYVTTMREERGDILTSSQSGWLTA